jgi:hypothetical protein
MIKRILSAALALIAAFIILKVIWWVIRSSFFIAISVFEIIILVIVALPIYVIISRRLFR